jgi:hypothetical protein
MSSTSERSQKLYKCCNKWRKIAYQVRYFAILQRRALSIFGRFGQRQMGSSADDDDDDNRDYEGEHMRLVKNTHTFCTGTKRALYTGYDG